jgi:hypothetical protein
MAMSEIESRAIQRARNLPPRDARGRFVARPGATPKAAHVAPAVPRDASDRTRSLPSRDARGRFVAFPMTSAPSWYVFCADSYRIPGDAEVMAMAIDARLAPQPQPLPPARIVRRHRPPMRWDEIATWILIAIFVGVVGWYGLHLQLPHH